VAVAIFVPSSRNPADAPIDWIGVILSILFSAGLVGSLIEGPDRGWNDPLVLGGLFGSALVLVAFCAWELHVAHPLINVRFFGVPQFSVGCTVVALQYFLSFGTSFVVTLYLQLVLGYSALKAGVALMPSAALVTVVAPLGARVFGRFGARRVIPCSLLILAAGGAALLTVGVNSSYWPIFAALMANSLGIGLMAAGTTSMVMQAVPPDQSGMASGTQSATRQLGGALGIAVMGSLLAARYTSSLSSSLAKAGAASFASVASRSLAAALDVPHATAAVRLLVARLARAAFVDGVHVVGMAVLVLAALSAVGVGLWLPRRARSRSNASLRDLPVDGAPSVAVGFADPAGQEG
jgi:Na+/melibiose symporter-like transporter